MNFDIFIFVICIFLGSFLAYLVYKHKEKQKQKSFKIIEMELIENLKELKKQIEPIDYDKKFSGEFDLVELALNYDLDDIVVTNDEGFIIASTYEDSEEFGSIIFRIFENIKKSLKKVKKVIIQSNGYILIYPMTLMNENLYIIIKTKILPDSVDEKKILEDIKQLLEEKYLKPLKNIEEIPTEAFVTKSIENIEENVINI